MCQALIVFHLILTTVGYKTFLSIRKLGQFNKSWQPRNKKPINRKLLRFKDLGGKHAGRSKG